MQTIVVRRTGGIGDAIVATVVADALIAVGHPVVFQCHRSIHPVIARHPRISKVTERDAACHVDLDGVYEKSGAKTTAHLQWLFSMSAQAQLRRIGITVQVSREAKPSLVVPAPIQSAHRARLAWAEKPWVFICPRSDHYNVRSVPDTTWGNAAKDIEGTKFWLGRTPAPPGIVDFHVQTIIQVMDFLAVADLLLAVDTGPMHIAAALGVPTVVIFQAVNPALRLPGSTRYEAVKPDGLTCLNCQRYECPINRFLPPCQTVDPDKIAAAAKKMLQRDPDGARVAA